MGTGQAVGPSIYAYGTGSCPRLNSEVVLVR